MTLPRCASDGVTSQGFSSFILACNENSDHFIIVLSKGCLCFVAWVLTLAVVVYRCGLCLRTILVVDLSIGGWRLVTLLVLTRCAWCRFGGIVCLTRCRLGWYSQRSYRRYGTVPLLILLDQNNCFMEVRRNSSLAHHIFLQTMLSLEHFEIQKFCSFRMLCTLAQTEHYKELSK